MTGSSPLNLFSRRRDHSQNRSWDNSILGPGSQERSSHEPSPEGAANLSSFQAEPRVPGSVQRTLIPSTALSFYKRSVNAFITSNTWGDSLPKAKQTGEPTPYPGKVRGGARRGSAASATWKFRFWNLEVMNFYYRSSFFLFYFWQFHAYIQYIPIIFATCPITLY